MTVNNHVQWVHSLHVVPKEQDSKTDGIQEITMSSKISKKSTVKIHQKNRDFLDPTMEVPYSWSYFVRRFPEK